MPRSVRVGGAEKHGRRWRVREFDGNGGWRDRYFEGGTAETDARAYVVAFRSRAKERTVGALVTEYLEHLRRYGGQKRRPLTEGALRGVRAKLVYLLQLVDPRIAVLNRGRRTEGRVENPVRDRLLSEITSHVAQRMYEARVAQVSPDTHRGDLMYVQAMYRWALDRGYVRVNPFEGVLPEGELSCGKLQLTMDEARAFAAACYRDQHATGGIAAVGVLTLGLRANELLERRVRDLDDGGKVLRVQFGKTVNAKRPVAVPPVLRSCLVRLAEGLTPDEYLFGTMTANTLLDHVKRLCGAAGVPEVCTQALRGTQISLTVEVGALVKAASAGAGHADTTVTRRHYMAAGVEASARAKLMEELLLGDVVANRARELEEAQREAEEARRKLEAVRARVTETLGLGTTGSALYPTGEKLN